jgi:hypothetical protein
MSRTETPQTPSDIWEKIDKNRYKAPGELVIYSTTKSSGIDTVAMAKKGDIVETEGKPIRNFHGGLSIKITLPSLKMLQDKHHNIYSFNDERMVNGYIKIAGNSESIYVSTRTRTRTCSTNLFYLYESTCKNDTSKAFTKEEVEKQKRKRTTSSSGEEAGPSTLEYSGKTANKRKKADDTPQNTEIDADIGDILDNGGTLRGGPNNNFPIMTVKNEDTYKSVKINLPICMLQTAFDLFRGMPEGVKVGVSLNKLDVSTSESTDEPTSAPTDGPIP